MKLQYRVPTCLVLVRPRARNLGSFANSLSCFLQSACWARMQPCASTESWQSLQGQWRYSQVCPFLRTSLPVGDGDSHLALFS